MPSADFTPIPDDGVLLHIGPHKTGTTALQTAAEAAREALAAHGVLYPGTRHNHTAAAISANGAASGWLVRQRTAADPSKWSELVAEVERRRGRALVSSELFCEASPDVARRIVHDLGTACVRVVITLRSMARVLPSAWVQAVRGGSPETCEEYLHRRLVEVPRPAPDAPFDAIPPFWLRYDHSALIERWSRVVGPDNVTVVVLEGGHDVLPSAFAGLLGLDDPELLRPGPGTRRNRSLTAGEVEALRLVNESLSATTMTWQEYGSLVRRGAARRVAEARMPDDDEPGVATPEWARAVAAELDASTVATVNALGVRVVGEPELLREASAEAPTTSSDEGEPWLPASAAAEAVLGTLGAALTNDPWFEGTPRAVPLDRKPGNRITPRAERAIGTVSTRELLREVRRRIARPDRLARRRRQRSTAGARHRR